MALKKKQSGFTMIEILVVMGIFVVITGVTISNFPDLNNRLSLDLLAHDIALEIRKTQTYSLGFSSRPGLQDLQRYGVHLEKDIDGKIASFKIFADTNPDERFSPDDQVIDTITIQSRSRINKLFKNDCTQAACEEVSELDILFKRPNPDAEMKCDGASCDCGGSLCGMVGLVVISPKNETKKILVKQTGQISVESIQ